MCDKAVDAYISTIKFVPECFMTLEMCDQEVNRFFLYLLLFLLNIKLKKCATDMLLL